MLFYFLILSIIVNFILGFAVWRAFQKVTIYEEFCESVLSRLKEILTDIRAIDIRGSFEADDEVGLVYTAISSLIQTLQVFIPDEELDGQTKEE